MRPGIILLTACLIVVVIVLSIVFFAPTPTKSRVEVVRIDINRQPQPILQSDPVANRILDFFPTPSHTIPLPPAPIPEDRRSAATPPPQPETALSEEHREELDRNRLLSLIDDWVYVDFSQIGSSKLGRILQTRDNIYREITEGAKLDNGILIEMLNREKATLRLGKGTFDLRLAQEPEFFNEVKTTMRPLTPEEQSLAYDYYMRRFGDKFKAMSEKYTPPQGMVNPKPVTSEERQKGLQEYMERYGKKFQKEAKEFKGQFPYGEKQKEMYEKYWKVYHPGQPMPEFDQLYKTSEPGAPGSRIQPAGAPQSK